MTTRATSGYEALSEKERQTLRLIVRGHDAKSVARHLDLSVHTINERLRDARRKLAVSSSREAARLVLEREGDAPDSVGDQQIGEAAADPAAQSFVAPESARNRRVTRIAIGATTMTFALGLIALVLQPQNAANAPAATPPAASEATDASVVAAAQQWLELVDQGRWDDSWRATATSFRKLNTSQVWADVSNKVRTPLGAVVSRTLISQENLPAPPHGYEVVKFRTSFANRANAVETVSLDREDGVWRVVGVTIG